MPDGGEQVIKVQKVQRDEVQLPSAPVLRTQFRDLVSATLAFGLLALIAAVTLTSLYQAFSGTGISLPQNADLETVKAWATMRRAYADAQVDGSMKVFDVVIVKALLPAFSAIVGFVVGSRAEKS